MFSLLLMEVSVSVSKHLALPPVGPQCLLHYSITVEGVLAISGNHDLILQPLLDLIEVVWASVTLTIESEHVIHPDDLS